MGWGAVSTTLETPGYWGLDEGLEEESDVLLKPALLYIHPLGGPRTKEFPVL